MVVVDKPKATEKFLESFSKEIDSYDSSGSNCAFFDLGNSWGIKCYHDKDDFECSYEVQKYLSKKNLAPRVLESFEVKIDEYEIVYCYFTEVAEGLVGYGYENSHAFADDDYDGVDSEGEFDYDMVYFHRDEREEYNEKFKEATRHWYMDNHVGNYGWIERNGNKILVSIDFDSCWDAYKSLKKDKKIK